MARPGTPFVYVVNSVVWASMRRHARVMFDGRPVVMNVVNEVLV